MEQVKVLFVCMGNICRSPTAEGVFNALLKKEKIDHQFFIESAGTHAYHIGEAPDLRAQKAAKDRGVSLSQIRARKVIFADFENFDYVLAMDDDNYQILMQSCPDEYKNRVKYFLDYAPHLDSREVPDPYYGGQYGFERVLDMVADASVGFLETLRESEEVK
ncbi:MAG: low molecular weight phosphotyrosine protein phosphatase [Methylococcales symbiont of Hymedesmia sp. n. MRB-2018]|nr:MAG: low molecular weight phosphotyrosine protein phosphatase [Methylococcales symbiont of Hymedesmia sp. n. MRB-2018]KAF3983472.1 MAG: low molecular weight phosphotyrosine protein phosphatase [Methylococcales symbiont of Hymedesmia sp. n. MRB-2018]